MSPDQIAAELRSDLTGRRLVPGTELSSVALATRFSVSRIPVRDALRILAGEGLVRIEPNRGARVLSLSVEEVRELYDLRILLECDALRRSAAQMSAADLEDIERARLHSDLDAATPDWSEGDWAFHRALYRPSGHGRQIEIIAGLRRTCQLYVQPHARMTQKTRRWLDDHRRIVEHLRAGESAAAVEVLREHLEVAAGHVLQRMTPASPGT